MDKDSSRIEELSSVSTNDDSPRQERFHHDLQPVNLGEDLLKTSPNQTERKNENEIKIEKLSSYVVKLKKALEQQKFAMNEQVIWFCYWI